MSRLWNVQSVQSALSLTVVGYTNFESLERGVLKLFLRLVLASFSLSFVHLLRKVALVWDFLLVIGLESCVCVGAGKPVVYHLQVIEDQNTHNVIWLFFYCLCPTNSVLEITKQYLPVIVNVLRLALT